MTKQQLIEMANGVIKDGRHWGTVDVADRADMGESLAVEVLNYFRRQPPVCPKNCEECQEHEKNLA